MLPYNKQRVWLLADLQTKNLRVCLFPSVVSVTDLLRLKSYKSSLRWMQCEISIKKFRSAGVHVQSIHLTKENASVLQGIKLLNRTGCGIISCKLTSQALEDRVRRMLYKYNFIDWYPALPFGTKWQSNIWVIFL